ASTIINHPKPSQRVPKALPESILLDPWLTTASLPQGQPLASLIASLAPCLPKARTDAAQRQLEVLSTLLANFAVNHPLTQTASPPLAPQAIAVPMGKLKATRYDRPAITGRQLAPVISALEACGSIDLTSAIFKQRRTIIAPTAKLRELIAKHHVTAASITRLPDEEIIILKRREVRKATAIGDASNVDGGDGDEPFSINPDSGTLIDYPDDCHEANALRNQLRAYNVFISKSDIRIVGNIINPPPSFKPFKRFYASNGPVQFNLHGRLYAGQVGGWLQNLHKEQRHLIRINGESVVDLDFSNMHMRLAYREARCTPPDGVDLYAIKGLEAYRPALKICISAMISRIGGLKKLPSKARELLPKQWTGQSIAQAIREHHAPIAHLFGQDKGMQYMWQDSEILMEVLTRLMHLGIPALPMHDGIMVQASKRELALKIMQEVAMDLLGVVLPVEAKVY
ncbi:MAG: hypothetical protein ABJA10_10220, partial [Aestuariivirga sp.]